MSTPERSSPASSPAASVPRSLQATKPQRVLACVLCQQRKVKCNRKFPCENCIRSNALCVPATPLATRQRRQRFPERKLLDRLRHYESLLRSNNVKFEPLHQDASITEDEPLTIRNEDRGDGSQGEKQLVAGASVDRSSSPSLAIKSETVHGAKSIWHGMNLRAQSQDPNDDSSDSSPDDVREDVIKRAWSDMYQTSDHLLFGSRETDVDLLTLHPEQVQIFRLWQIYIDNVNPLLKVIHIPTLQGRIIDAASNMSNIKPTSAALMFSIYCVAILSLSEDECRSIFGLPRENLLTKYQFGCQQALRNCAFLRSNDRDCLTAMYLYLISIRPSTDPASLSSLLGIAMRTAQRMGLHRESAYAKCTALEAEMRRRLWWSLILFDTRMCELTDYKLATLDPTWDCRPPLNVNDSDLQPEMKEPPAIQERPTEALFAVVRGEMGDFVRHSAFFLDFLNPALKAVAKNAQHGHTTKGGELVALERMIEDKYIKFCNPENPLHLMTVWTARGYLARNRLLEHYSTFPLSSVQQTENQRDTAVSHALHLLECDTNIMSSPLTKGYHWYMNTYFPAPAYIHIVQDLKRRPMGILSERAWEMISNNYEARSPFLMQFNNPMSMIFGKILLQAWDARETAFNERRKPLPPQPQVVSDIKQRAVQMAQDTQKASTEHLSDGSSMTFGFSTPLSLDSSDQSLLYGMGGPGGFPGPESMPYHNMPGQAALDVDFNDMTWPPMDWNMMQGCGW